MEKAIWILLTALVLFVVVFTAMLLQGAGITQTAEGIAQLNVGKIKQGGLLFTVGAAMLTSLGLLVTLLKSRS